MQLTKWQRFGLGAVAISILLAAWWSAPMQSNKQEAKPIATSIAGVPMVTVPQSIAATSQNTISIAATIENPRPTRHSTQFEELQSVVDLRVFAEKSKQNPSNGGAHFAILAFVECFQLSIETHTSGILHGGPIKGPKQMETETLSSRRVMALDRLKTRCATYSIDELKPAASNNLRDIAGRNDPLYNLKVASQKSASSTTASERVKLASQLLDANDESFFERVRTLLVDQAPNPPHQWVNHFEGRPDSGLPAPVSQLAWQIAQCTYFQSCDRFDSRSDAICARGGGCGDTFRETVLTSLPLTQPQRAAVVAIGERIAAALRARNFSAFARPAA